MSVSRRHLHDGGGCKGRRVNHGMMGLVGWSPACSIWGAVREGVPAGWGRPLPVHVLGDVFGEAAGRSGMVCKIATNRCTGLSGESAGGC